MPRRPCPDCGARPLDIPTHTAKGRCGRWPHIDQLAERWPSLRWGQAEWYAALQADDRLFYAILDGIARRGAAAT